jgi:branched-chain amino acid transport system substrate-binding protein
MFVRRLVSIGIAVAMCLFPTLAVSAAPATGAPYDIDVVLPITGTFAFIGTTHVKELTVLEGIVNKEGGIQGRPVNFIFHDDTSNPEVSLQIHQTILAKHPAVVLGSSLGALCQATTPLYLTNGPVNYCFSPVIPTTKDSYVFSGSVGGRDLIKATIRYFRGKGWKKFATLNTTDASGQIADRDIAFILGLPEFKDMSLVTAEHFGNLDTSVTAQVSKIKALDPQAMIIWAPGTALGTALHAVSDVGLDVPIATTSANMIVPQMKSYASFIPKTVLFQGVGYVAGAAHKDSPAMAMYVNGMKDNGMLQDFQTGIAWDPAMIVIDALKKLGPNATAKQLHDYIENLHDYTGITGTYDFRDGSQRGIGVDATLIMKWEPDKADFVTVSKPGGNPL